MINNDTSITIKGWMVTKLELSRSLLIAYAMIYEFSCLQGSEYRGGIKGISQLCKCTPGTAKALLVALEAKDLIVAEDLTLDDKTTIATYYANTLRIGY